MNYFLKYFLQIIIVLFLNKNFSCLPIAKNELVPLEIRVLQNPKLFGGDILGINLTSVGLRNALPNDNQLWPMGIIPYEIDGNLVDHKNAIIEAMNQYHQGTCIRFVERTTEYDYIHISKDKGCYSFVGRTGGKQLVSLGEGCHSVGTIVHELGHSVGFYHEHQRSDRDSYIDIFKDNIAPGLNDQFFKLNANENRLFVPFDFSSIMLYGPLTFSKDGKLKTMLPNAQHSNEKMLEVYQKYGLSKSDINAIQKLYQC